MFSTDRRTAVKVFRYEQLYHRELSVYQRLTELKISKVQEFSVPKFLDSDEDLLVLEMTLVRPPFVLDFAGASLDQRHDFPIEIMQQWEDERREMFEDDWPRVKSLISAFAGLGIYLSDVKPGNVTLR